MKLFGSKQRRKSFEALPTQITGNDRITCWHDTEDGSLTALVVDGTAESPAGKEKYRLLLALSLIGSIAAGFFANGAIAGQAAGSGWLCFWGAVILFAVLRYLCKCACSDTRICRITANRVHIERPDGEREYALTDVVGVQLLGVDGQRIFDERRKKKDQKDPEFLEPFSMDVFLETSLGLEELGCIFGLKDAQAIANSMNAAIQYMKGRQGIGEGPVLNPAHQYRTKTAGRIPA